MPAKPSSKQPPSRKKKDANLPKPGPFREGQIWTREDHHILRLYYPTKGAAWVARKLGRTQEAIRIKASRVGLLREGSSAWSKKELTYLCRNYHKKTPKELAEALGRPVGSVNGQVGVLRRKAKHDPDFPFRLQPNPSFRRWSGKDVRYLRRVYGTIPTIELAQRLGRSTWSVQGKASALGITYPHKHDPARKRAPNFRVVRTIEEGLSRRQKKFILENMTRLGCAEIARRLELPHIRVLRFAQRNGYHGEIAPKRWKPTEVEFLRAHFRTMLIKDIAAALGRSAEVTATKAREIGLPSKEGCYYASHRWNEKEDTRLKELHPVMTLPEIARELGRSVSAVTVHARRMGLRRAVPKQKRAG